MKFTETHGSRETSGCIKTVPCHTEVGHIVLCTLCLRIIGVGAWFINFSKIAVLYRLGIMIMNHAAPTEMISSKLLQFNKFQKKKRESGIFLWKLDSRVKLRKKTTTKCARPELPISILWNSSSTPAPYKPWLQTTADVLGPTNAVNYRGDSFLLVRLRTWAKAKPVLWLLGG